MAIMQWIIFILLCSSFLLLCFVGTMVWAIGRQLSELIEKNEKL
tara:strand:- start:170 stop:301 length:132 start_codon:yes stop_codon:yes gene_type:complete